MAFGASAGIELAVLFCLNPCVVVYAYDAYVLGLSLVPLAVPMVLLAIGMLMLVFSGLCVAPVLAYYGLTRRSWRVRVHRMYAPLAAASVVDTSAASGIYDGRWQLASLDVRLGHASEWVALLEQASLPSFERVVLVDLYLV